MYSNKEFVFYYIPQLITSQETTDKSSRLEVWLVY